MLLGLAPDAITAWRFGAGLRPHDEGHWRATIENVPTDQPAKAVEVLSQMLGELARPADDVVIVLSNHFARYAIVPGDPAIRRADEQLALAQIVFDQQYGSSARHWEIRIGGEERAKPVLASGVSRVLLDALRETCRGKVRLRSLRPALMPVFNQVRHSVGHGNAVVATVETGRITVAHIRDGTWSDLLSRATDPGDRDALKRILAESSALSGVTSANGTVWLCDLTGSARRPEISGWSTREVRLPAQVPVGEMSLAILGAIRP